MSNLARRIGRITIAAAAACFLIGGIGYVALRDTVFFPPALRSVHAIAQGIVEECKTTPWPPTCYEDRVPPLMDQGLTMEEALDVTKEILVLDPDYKYCHVIGHKIAEKEVAKDPTKWKEVAQRSPLSLCSYGVIHGAFQERFRAESMPNASVQELANLFNDVCAIREGSPSGERTNCMHAIGHLIMYVTEADAKKSVDVCKQIGVREDGFDMTRSCFEGLFMQMFQPLEPDDFNLIKGKAPQTHAERDRYCNQFSGMARATCRKESWPMYRDELETGKQVGAFCADVAGGDDGEYEYCISSFAYIKAAGSQFNADTFSDFCKSIPGKWAGVCLAYGAPRFMEIYWTDFSRTLRLCKDAEALGAGDKCYQMLVSYSTNIFNQGSKEAYQLCDVLPEKWKLECRGLQDAAGAPRP